MFQQILNLLKDYICEKGFNIGNDIRHHIIYIYNSYEMDEYGGEPSKHRQANTGLSSDMV